MPKYPSDITDQTQAVIEAWKRINPDMKVGDLTLNALTASLAQVAPLVAEIKSVDAQSTDLRNKRDALYDLLWEYLKRVRAAVKGNYGDNSSEYEMVGGTRLSERKPSGRKPQTPASS
jgi:flagellar hook-associated protein FlgK